MGALRPSAKPFTEEPCIFKAKPFTKDPCVSKAKPASKTAKCLPMKKFKEIVN